MSGTRSVANYVVLLMVCFACTPATNPDWPAGTFYLSGRVTDSSTGAPLDSVTVYVWRPCWEGCVTSAQAATDTAGYYQLTFTETWCRESSGYLVAASRPGYLSSSSKDLPCGARGSPYVIDFTLRPDA